MLNGTESSLNVINRLAASNSDITITSTHGSPQQQHHPQSSSSSSSSTSLQHSSSNGNGGGGGTQHSRSSPTSDFLADSPSKLVAYGLLIHASSDHMYLLNVAVEHIFRFCEYVDYHCRWNTMFNKYCVVLWEALFNYTCRSLLIKSYLKTMYPNFIF